MTVRWISPKNEHPPVGVPILLKNIKFERVEKFLFISEESFRVTYSGFITYTPKAGGLKRYADKWAYPEEEDNDIPD